MTQAHKTDNEVQRIDLITQMELANLPEDLFNDITEMAALLFEPERAGISIVQEEYLHFYSHQDFTQQLMVHREQSWCKQVLVSGEVVVIEDLSKDDRFRDNPYANGEIASQKFYAGAPIVLNNDLIIGTMWLVDSKVRSFTERDKLVLEKLRDQVADTILSHHYKVELEHSQQQNKYSLARFNAIFEEAAAGIIRIDHKGGIKAVNHYLLELLGYEESDLIERNVKCLMPETWAAEHDHYLQRYLSGGQPAIIGTGRKVSALHKSGREIPVHLAVSEVIVNADEYPEFIGILSDLTALNQAEERERKERALMKSIIDASSEPIFVKDIDGNYIIGNQASLAAADVTEEDAQATNVTKILSDEEFEKIAAAEKEVIEQAQGKKITVTLMNNAVYEVTKSPILGENGSVTGIVNIAHDVTELIKTNKTLVELHRQKDSQQHLLTILHKGLTDYQALMSGNELWEFFKIALRELTQSDYALIGEVITQNNQPELKIHAISDLSWSDESRELMQQLRAGNMTLSNADTLLGKVFAAGEVVLTNDMANEPGIRVFPQGHPKIHNYLGVPIYDSGDLIGMFAIANSSKPYDQSLIQYLQPFTATCALLIKLYRQMAENERAAQALARARDKEAAANRAKTDFLSSMSHELRTPLNSILGFSQLLLGSRSNQLVDKQRDQVEQIYKSGGHLLALINEVLDLAKIESGTVAVSLESISLGDVLQDALETVSSIAEKQNISVQNMPEQVRQFIIEADYTRLKQVLINLLSNAIKYNRENGTVEIRLHEEENTVSIGIQDSGMGIATENMQAIFEPFNRLNAENTSIEGTGVGLAITKKLVELMHAEINVESELGEGSVFWIKMQKAAVQAVNSSELMRESTSSTAEIEKTSTILYIEDNPANQRLMQAIIGDFDNLELEITHDVSIGLGLARARQPDVIIMDINLPGISGLEACKQIKQDEQLKHIPVIALSANAMKADIQTGMEAGFDDYLTKPVNIDILVETLSRFIGTLE